MIKIRRYNVKNITDTVPPHNFFIKTRALILKNVLLASIKLLSDIKSKCQSYVDKCQ